MATKSAIGKLAQDAINKIAACCDVLEKRLGVLPLDLESVRFRDPAYEHAARLDAIATWIEQVAEKTEGLDLSGAMIASDKLEQIRLVLELALESLTRKDLEAIAADLGIEAKGTIKQEVINPIVDFLTGERIVSEDGTLPPNFEDPEPEEYE